MKRFERGLVVGKFCPLHRGHQLLIEHALSQSVSLLLLSYTRPDFAHCGVEERERWFRLLYPTKRYPHLQIEVMDEARLRRRCAEAGLAPAALPHNDDADDVHREFCGWLLRHLLGGPVDAVFTSEDYGAGFAASLSRQFPQREAVAHVSFDRERRQAPVSGSALRGYPALRPLWLAADVQASFIGRIAILGGESSGKTALASALGDALGAEWVPEYGRELWLRNVGVLSYEDLQEIARVQVEREYAAVRRARRWIVCDTTPLTTLLYSQMDHGRAEPALVELSKRFYDVTVLCEPDFAFHQDGTRRDADFRERQHREYRKALDERGVSPLSARGPLRDRVAALRQTIGG